MSRTYVAFFLATTLAAGCGSDDEADTPRAVESQGWTVTALTPTLAAGGQVQGAMRLERTSGAATRGGGVCLLADLGGGLPCQDATACAALPLPAGGFHYCAGINGSSAKTCWTRPGAGELYCNRGPSREPGTFTTPPVGALVAGRSTTWMAYACLANEDNPGGCATTDPTQYVVATSPTLRSRP
jgi:hypothetical protein